MNIPGTSVSPELLAKAAEWCRRFGVPGLERRVTIEYSSRITSGLGRCYPQEKLIRLAAWVRDRSPEVLPEVLCHELAHLAVRELHGPRRPHGREWRELVARAGFIPRARLPLQPPLKPRPRRGRAAGYVYIHHCPVCHAARLARRAMRSWRCMSCREAGLSGELKIERYAEKAVRVG
jgi:predicted SprT family Zn-dependent metalloprotease